MAFDRFETSRAMGEPVDLFLFRYGTEPGAYYAYTDSEHLIEHEGIAYQSIPIRRGNFTASGTLDKQALKIDTPITAELADLFRIHPPGQVIALTIRQGHVNDVDNDFPVIWMGRVLSCKRDNMNAEFTCEPFHTAMRRSGLRRNYQYGCPHVLYGPRCKADREAATIQRPIVNIQATRVTLEEGWNPHPVEKYYGGYVEWMAGRGLERRTILRVLDEVTLSLSGPTLDMTMDQPLTIVLGCNHKHGVTDEEGDCTNLHNNILNYGGQPWIPTKNPINSNPFY